MEKRVDLFVEFAKISTPLEHRGEHSTIGSFDQVLEQIALIKSGDEGTDLFFTLFKSQLREIYFTSQEFKEYDKQEKERIQEGIRKLFGLVK